MGADPNQLIKALREAEAYPGPAVIIAYAPCTAHGIRRGMREAQNEMKRAVAAGYWLLYRYNPANTDRPLTVDSAEPSLDFDEFLDGETRYAALWRTYPENARELFAIAKKDALARYERYKRMEASQMNDVVG